MSTQRRIYLDFNATAPLLPAARDAMVEAMADVGNPSSIHAEGRRMRDRVERARNHVAGLVGRPREEVIFTSGGTEANWLGVMALAAAAEARGLPRVVMTTLIEHPSLRGPIAGLRARGWAVIELRADPKRGLIPPIAEHDPRQIGLFAAGLVNHEIGLVLDDELLAWVKRGSALVHLDAVQAAGKRRLADRGDLHADSIAISSHKIGGPQGSGALAISLDAALPLIEGGHQERGRRPGTENTLGIVGFGAAAATVRGELDAAFAVGDGGAAVVERTWAHAEALGRRFEQTLVDTIERARVPGPAHVGSTVHVRFEGARGESIVMGLDLEGISVSTGAACTSGSIQPSPVLLGLGLSPEQAREGVRFSLGPTTTEAEIKRVLEVLPAIVERARRHR